MLFQTKYLIDFIVNSLQNRPLHLNVLPKRKLIVFGEIMWFVRSSSAFPLNPSRSIKAETALTINYTVSHFFLVLLICADCIQHPPEGVHLCGNDRFSCVKMLQ